MSQDDFYASPFGAAYSAYMERPRLARLLGRTVWGGDVAPYYESMAAVARAPEGGTIVDCPCGAGPALRALSPQRKVHYIAVDLSPSMLRRFRKRADRRGLSPLELVQADATDLPLADNSADLFLSYWGLHCFPDPAAALAEAARVLKVGGRLVGSAFVRGRDSLRQRCWSARAQATSATPAPPTTWRGGWSPPGSRNPASDGRARCSSSTLSRADRQPWARPPSPAPCR